MQIYEGVDQAAGYVFDYRNLYGNGVGFTRHLIRGFKGAYINDREGEEDDSPYFLNLDTNPIMENCTDEEITEIVENMWNKLIELNLNNFSFEFNGNPLIEVGDIISIPERSLETYVASCEWTYHGKEKISCVSVDKNKRTETQREKQNENGKKDRITAYWTFEGLRKQLMEKHPSTLWVSADERTEGEMVQFRYKEIEFSRAPQFATFLALINAGIITYDWRGYTSETGAYSGKNHGNAWRIKPAAKEKLFGDIKKITL